MGVSTDAYLFYGVHITEGEDLPELNVTEEEWEEKYFGCFDEYLAGNLKVEGVEFDSHCHHEYPYYFLCVKRERAARGYPEDISPEFLKIDTEKADRLLQEALDQLGFKALDKPGWKLASYWG